MKAAIWTAYGPPETIVVGEVPTPEPGRGEVRIRVAATTVTAGDCEMRALKFPLYLALPMRIFAGLLRPARITILGQELAGTVDMTGPGVTRFQPGDEVFAATAMPGLGAHAEYLVMPEAPGEGMLERRPPSLSAEEAAALPFAAFEALHFLTKAKVVAGEKLLVIGAGGSIGTYAVQIAKAMGARVAAVDRAAKHEALRQIGADELIDATASAYGPTGACDVVLDVVGRRTFRRGFQALRRGGRYASANPRFSLLFRAPWARLAAGQRVVVGTAGHGVEARRRIAELVAAGRLRPVVGARFTLDDIVAAHRYAESADKIGNVVVVTGTRPPAAP